MSDSESFESADEEGPTGDRGKAGAPEGGVSESPGNPANLAQNANHVSELQHTFRQEHLEPSKDTVPCPAPSAEVRQELPHGEPAVIPASAVEKGHAIEKGSRAHKECDERPVGEDDVCARRIFDRLSQATEKEHQPKAAASSGSWGSWGRWSSAILSTAVSSVSTFTGHVGEGLHTVLEGLSAAPQLERQLQDNNVQAVPVQAEPAVIHEQPKEVDVHDQPTPFADGTSSTGPAEQQDGGTEHDSAGIAALTARATAEPSQSDWFSQWGMQELTATVQSSTRSLVSTGLDVLESIGKKTVAVLAETDPGLKKTKSLFQASTQKPSLSQLLQEAKQREEHTSSVVASQSKAVVLTYNDLLEQFQGLAHFEALEMLSQSCSSDLNSIDVSGLDENVSGASHTMHELGEIFSVENVNSDSGSEEPSLVAILTEGIAKLSLPLNLTKLSQAYDRAKVAMDDLDAQHITKDERSLPASGDGQPAAEKMHDSALRALAELTACALEVHHKFGELVLHNEPADNSSDDKPDYKSFAEEMARLTRILCYEVTVLSSYYSDRLDLLDDAAATERITSVFVEATKSSTYIQDSFCLLLPVVQKSFVASCLSPSR